MTGGTAILLRDIAHWICGGAGLVGIALIWRGLSPRRVDGYPHCATCNYNLNGLPGESSQCPECGADLKRPGQIRRGTFARSTRHVLLGLALATIAVSGWYGMDSWAHSVWQRRFDLTQAILKGNGKEITRIAALEPQLLQANQLAFSIHFAIRAGDVATLTQLSSLGISLAALPREDSSDRPLIEAVESGNDAVFDLLMASGCDVNAVGPGRTTPLHTAVQRQNLRAIEKLIAAGAKVDTEDAGWNTPLHAAVNEYWHLPAAQALLDRGVSVDIQNQIGATPLHSAMERNDYDAAWFLICHGADITIRGKGGVTLARLGEEASGYSIAGEIWARVLIDAVAANRQDHARALLHADPWALRPGTPRYSPVAGWLLLRMREGVNVTWEQRAAALKLLFEEGVSPNQANAKGYTLLQQAKDAGQIEIYQFLLSQGAGPEIREVERDPASAAEAARYYFHTKQHTPPTSPLPAGHSDGAR